MRKNTTINTWASFPSTHEMLLWGIAGIVFSLAISGLAATGVL